jgi:hypothetical protein
MEEWCTFIRHRSGMMPFDLLVGARPMAALVVVAKTRLQDQLGGLSWQQLGKDEDSSTDEDFEYSA